MGWITVLIITAFIREQIRLFLSINHFRIVLIRILTCPSLNMLTVGEYGLNAGKTVRFPGQNLILISDFTSAIEGLFKNPKINCKSNLNIKMSPMFNHFVCLKMTYAALMNYKVQLN